MHTADTKTKNSIIKWKYKKQNTETTEISTTSIHLLCLRKCITVNTTFIRINIEISDDTKTMYICIYIFFKYLNFLYCMQYLVRYTDGVEIVFKL